MDPFFAIQTGYTFNFLLIYIEAALRTTYRAKNTFAIFLWGYILFTFTFVYIYYWQEPYLTFKINLDMQDVQYKYVELLSIVF